MKKWYAMLLPLITVVAAGCSGAADAPATSKAVDPSSESVEQSQSDLSAAGCLFKDPPRCGPRNCVAMCVTCLLDICMISGGNCTDCRREMELCKHDCGE